MPGTYTISYALRIPYLLQVAILMLLLNNAAAAQQPGEQPGVFARNNLVAWCIVPFDNKNRTPEERCLMLRKLGITRLAYDWREKHIPTFDEELVSLKKHGIRLEAFWYMSGMEPEKDKTLQLVFDLLQRHGMHTQLWLMMTGEKSLEGMSQEEKVAAMAKPVRYIAEKAAAIGCTVGLYNHGGWYGEPLNQVALIKHLKLPNIGMVYNFSHSEYQIRDFPQFFPQILPYLHAINITGLKGGHPATVVPVGQGNIEAPMMRLIRESAYRGPIGIINEDFAPDAADGLQMNLKGIRQILEQWGDKATLATY